MNNHAAFEFETFKKCLEAKFGPDMGMIFIRILSRSNKIIKNEIILKKRRSLLISTLTMAIQKEYSITCLPIFTQRKMLN